MRASGCYAGAARGSQIHPSLDAESVNPKAEVQAGTSYTRWARSVLFSV